jgi:MFS family permease
MTIVKRILTSNSFKKLTKSNLVWTVGIVVLVFAVLAYSIRRDWNTILTFHWQLNWGHLAEMVLMHFLALGAMYLAWHFIMYRLAQHNVWRVSFRIFGISMLARRIPLPIWFLGSRVVLYKELDTPAKVTLTASILETALIAISGIICYVLLLPWYSYTQNMAWWLLLIPTGLLISVFLIRPGIFIEMINWFLIRLGKQPIHATLTRRDLLQWGGLYLLTWFLDGLGFYFAVAAFLPNPPPIASILGISTISAMIGLVSMALPSGFGLKELASGSLLSSWIPLTIGVVLAFVYRFLQTIVEAIWVIISQYLQTNPQRKMKNNS